MREYIYCIKYIGLEEEVVNCINETRKTKLREINIFFEQEKEAKKELDLKRYLCSVISDILVSFCLKQNFPTIDLYYSEIFTELQNIQFNKLSEISKLRIITRKLNIQSVEFDVFIETSVYNGLGKKISDKNFKNEIDEYVENSIKFLREVNSYDYEFDSIFLKIIDDACINYIGRSDYTNIFDREDEVLMILDNLKHRNSFYKCYLFDIENVINVRNGRLVDAKVDDLKGNYYRQKDIKLMVEDIINLKKICNEKFKQQLAEKLIEKVDEIIPKDKADDRALFVDTIKRNLI